VAAKSSAAANTLIAVVDETQLRSEESAFWGGAFGSSIWDAPAAKIEDDMRLAVPLPALSSGIFETPPSTSQASGNALTDRSRPQGKTPSQPATPIPKQEEEAFVLKRGDKRKSEAISESEEEAGEEEAGEYDIPLVPETKEQRQARFAAKASRRAEKAARKEAKRARKAQRREAEQAAATESGEVEDEEPFDYSKAESVLHGKRSGGDREGGKKGKEPFDPYAKSADAPKGMRRLQTERAGKSHTFKS